MRLRSCGGKSYVPGRTNPAPDTFRLITGGPQLRHSPAAAVSDVDPDHAAGGPDRDRLPLRAPAAVPDAVAEQLTSSAASSPHGCPGPSTSETNTRAARARSARPASVTVSRTVAPAITAPAFPAAVAPGNYAGRPADTPGWTPDSGANVKARAPPERAMEPPPVQAASSRRVMMPS